MTNINITLNLPEDLVTEAQAAGILSEQRITEWLESELTRQKQKQAFIQDIEKLHALEPALTQEEINAEIRDYRAEKTTRRNTRSDNTP